MSSLQHSWFYLGWGFTLLFGAWFPMWGISVYWRDGIAVRNEWLGSDALWGQFMPLT